MPFKLTAEFAKGFHFLKTKTKQKNAKTEKKRPLKLNKILTGNNKRCTSFLAKISNKIGRVSKYQKYQSTKISKPITVLKPIGILGLLTGSVSHLSFATMKFTVMKTLMIGESN